MKPRMKRFTDLTAKSDKRNTFVIDSRMQKATAHAPCTVATHEKPTDWPDKWLLATWVLDFTIFTFVVLHCDIIIYGMIT